MFYLFGPLTLLIEVAACCIYVWLRWRQLRTNIVTNALSLLVGQNLPLYDGLRAMARGERGANKRILEDIATQLALGQPLAGAVRTAHRGVSGDVLGAIQAGEQAGTLPTVLRNIDRAVRDRTLRSVGSAPSFVYFILLTLFVLLHVAFICTFLVPKFRDIFADFGVRHMPPSTELLMSIVAGLHGMLGPLMGLFFLAIPAVLLKVLIGRYFLVRIPDRVQPLFRAIDAFSWFCPGVRQIVQTRALGRQLPILTASIRAGHDLPFAAQHAARTDANWFARRRLMHWSKRMISGEPPVAAARNSKLPAPLCAVVSRSHSTDSFIAELSYLSSYYERLTDHWERVAAGLIAPLLVLAASILVGFVTVALYMPMRLLMNALMAEVY